LLLLSFEMAGPYNCTTGLEITDEASLTARGELHSDDMCWGWVRGQQLRTQPPKH
jgi:hypothetical protein